MKKLFTIDDFAVAFISAMGYGFGYMIPMYLGWPELACLVACFALGIALEEIIGKIVFCKTVQQKTFNRIFTYVAILLVFLIAELASRRLLGASLLEDLEEEFAWVVGLPILGFVVNLCIRWYHVRKIRKLYGDGGEGYVFDLDKEDIEDTNKQNRPITAAYDADIAVKTKTGIYVGERNKKTIDYLGIPYAKPPVGNQRWKAPEPLPPSDNVFEAVNYGASAIQVEHKGSIIKHHRQSEDCLTLNICVAKEKAENKKPVLVLFHHGDFTCGGSVDPLLNGDNFVSEHPDTVFVSFNYRLGIFGFIDFSEVPGGDACPDTLNLGLLDQIAALKWIRENISAFGGDPDRITVLGFEAGASSILLLASSGQVKGLFRRAFVINDSPMSAYDTPEASRILAKDLLKETKVRTMEELLQLKTEVLKEAAGRLWQDMCAPTCDGQLIPADVYQAFRDGAASDIEFIIGIPSSQAQVFKSLVGRQRYIEGISSTLSDMKDYMDETAVSAMQKYIEAQKASSTELDVKSGLVDQWFALCIYRVAVMLSERGKQVHLLYWDEKPLIENLGSGTIDEIAALLGNSDELQIYGSVMKSDLSEILQSMLHKFINGEALQLYHNEIVGVDAFDWKAFPEALIISDGKLRCGTIEDRLIDIEGLPD